MSMERLEVHSQEKETAFEAQFRNREHYEITGGTTEVIRVKPVVKSGEMADKVPVLFAPGCMRTLDAYKTPIQTLVTAFAREVVSFNHPRIGGNENVEPGGAEQNYAKEELRKAHNILDVLEREQIGVTDVIAHSEGAINTIIAAELHPEKFRNIILYAPAGFMGENASVAGQMIGGWAEAMTHVPQTMEELQRTISNSFDLARYVALNPERSMREQEDIAKSHIQPHALQQLRERGIGIIIICPVDDNIFPIKEVTKNVRGESIDGFITVRGGHTKIETDPVQTVLAANLLNTLEANKKKREAPDEVVEPRIAA